MLFDAAEAATFAGDLQGVVALGDRIMRIPAATERDRFRQQVLIGFIKTFTGRHEEASRQFAEALARAEAIDDPRTSLWAADAASVGIELGAGLPYTKRAVELAREQGRLSLLQLALRRHASELIWNSQFELAYGAAQRVTASRWTWNGARRDIWPTWMANVEAVWGREEDARRHGEDALALGQRNGSAFLVSTAEWTLGFIELTAGRPVEAAERLLRLTSFERADVTPLISLPAVLTQLKQPYALRDVLRPPSDSKRFATGYLRSRPSLAARSSRAARHCSVNATRTRHSVRRLSMERRYRRFSAHARSCFTANGSGGSVAARKRAFTCARQPSGFAVSVPFPGSGEPRRSYGRPARPRASATRPRSISSPPRSSRSPGSSPTA
jgi:hypothetical protein